MSGPVFGQLFPALDGAGNPVFSCDVAEIRQNDRRLVAKLVAKEIVDDEFLGAARELVAAQPGGQELDLEIRYALCELDERACELLRTALAAKYPSVSAAIAGAEIKGENNKLHITLSERFSADRIEHLAETLEKEAHGLLGMHIKIKTHVRGDNAVSFEEERERLLVDISKRAAAESLANAGAPAAQNPGEKSWVKKKKSRAGGITFNAGDKTAVYGRPVARAVDKIGELSVESGKVCVSGEVCSAEKRKLNSGDKSVFSFDLYDGTGTMRVTKFFDSEEADMLEESVLPGMWFTVQGQVAYSQFERQDYIAPTAIVPMDKPVRRDSAKEKRVELHLHTKMSAMDSVCDVQKVMELAADMGHPAIAITDHGVVQAYPDVVKALKKLKKAGKTIKPLYGVEAYCINDIRKDLVVKGSCERGIDDEIVVFDLETTGLNPRECEIIEIAALKRKNGETVGSFHSLIKPRNPIPHKITELTGISDATVKSARPVDEVLPEFLDFIGGCPLCAHNADFDIAFLSAACAALGTARQFCSIDTLGLARAMMPQLAKHRLNDVAAAMGLTFRHHRADEDTAVLAVIFARLMDMLTSGRQIEKISEINGAVKASMSGLTPAGERAHPYHTIILAKNKEGLTALYRMVSDAHLKYYSSKRPIIPMSLLAGCRENLIIGSACEAGELFSSIVAGAGFDTLKDIAEFYDFLEIQPIGNNRFLIANGKASGEKQLMDFNRTVVRIGERLNKPVCATCDVHFLEPEHAVYREILMTANGFSDASNQAPLYYRSTDEMLKEFDYLGRDKAFEVVVANTNMIAGMCEEIEPLMQGTYPPRVEGSAEEIERRARERAMELYGVDGKLPDIVADRLETELTPIIKNGFDVMYVIARKLVALSNADGYVVGSRGSVGSSFVAFLTGITEVNALQPHYRCGKCRHSIFEEQHTARTGVDLPDMVCPVCAEKMIKDGFSIPFATFLGFDADKAPDIDLNFSGEYQAQIHRQTIEMFGVEQVFKAGTISGIQDKTAYGYVKHFAEEKGIELTKAESNRLVQGISGVKRTTGQHPGGLIIVPQGRTIYEFTPVQHPADDADSTIITTHFDFNAIHDNLLKLDLLGHDDPTMLRRLYDLSGIDPTAVPLDDSETMRIFTELDALGIETDDILERTGCAGIPEFGTKFVRGMLTETKPHSFDGLIRISGLSHGTNVWRYNAQDIVKKGVGTLDDLICARDDITLYLIEMGLEPKLAFTISETVRKGNRLMPEWIESMLEANVPEWYIESCKKIQYLFPRAHAVAYVMMAFRIAWFKVHRPLEFYCAYFSVRAPKFDALSMIYGDEAVCKRYRELKAKSSYVDAETNVKEKLTSAEEDTLITLEVCHEFYKRGFTFAPMDIYKSEVKNFYIEDGRIVPPLMAVPGLGEGAAQGIENARRRGPFTSEEDILSRCDRLSSTNLDKLRECGALSGLPKSEQLDLFDLLGF